MRNIGEVGYIYCNLWSTKGTNTNIGYEILAGTMLIGNEDNMEARVIQASGNDTTL